MMEFFIGISIILIIPIVLYLIGLIPNASSWSKSITTDFFDCVLRGLKILIAIIATLVIILMMYGIGSLFLHLIKLTI